MCDVLSHRTPVTSQGVFISLFWSPRAIIYLQCAAKVKDSCNPFPERGPRKEQVAVTDILWVLVHKLLYHSIISASRRPKSRDIPHPSRQTPCPTSAGPNCSSHLYRSQELQVANKCRPTACSPALQGNLYQRCKRKGGGSAISRPVRASQRARARAKAASQWVLSSQVNSRSSPAKDQYSPSGLVIST